MTRSGWRARALRSARLSAVARLSVLIVDDEKNIRHALRICLETMDADVVEAPSAPAALEAAARAVFDVRLPRPASRDRRAAST